MKQAARSAFILYPWVVSLDLLFIFLRQDSLRWISKPLLIPLLLLAYFCGASQKRGHLFYVICSALFFSWCGDLLLQAQNLFIPGLLSFLLAHVFYIIFFYRVGRYKKGLVQQRPLLVLPVILYIGLLLWVLFPYLGQLKIPVVLYSVTIGTMLLMAVNTRGKVNEKTSALFIAGATLFVLSDSILAIQLFMFKNLALSLCVMATYAAAQYLMVNAALAVDAVTEIKPA